MATRNNHNVGLLFTDEANSGLKHQYFAPIIDSVKRTLEAKGYDVMFLNASKANGQAHVLRGKGSTEAFGRGRDRLY